MVGLIIRTLRLSGLLLLSTPCAAKQHCFAHFAYPEGWHGHHRCIGVGGAHRGYAIARVRVVQRTGREREDSLPVASPQEPQWPTVLWNPDYSVEQNNQLWHWELQQKLIEEEKKRERPVRDPD
jgi:hypothetical protein